MRRITLFVILLILSVGLKAQNFFEQKRAEYKYASSEEKAKMDSVFQPLADKMQLEQVKNIGGVPFGISHEKAEVMLKNKFGTPEYNPGTTTISFKNIKYAGYDFDMIHFLFQSDGINTYMNSCIFITYANSLSDAIEKEKDIADKLLSKYKLFEEKDSNGNPMHGGGFSPLWDGDWKTLDFAEYGVGIHTDIIQYKDDLVKAFEIPYAVRIIYGPYNYVKEEF